MANYNKLLRSPTESVNYQGDVIGKNSEVFTAGDFVTATSTGLDVAAASTAIIGSVVKTQTMTSDNQTVAKVKPVFQAIDQSYQFIMNTNADLSPLASIGVTYNITGTTGAQLVDVTGGATTGADAIVSCVQVDPFGIGGTGSGSGLRVGVFKVVRVQGAQN